MKTFSIIARLIGLTGFGIMLLSLYDNSWIIANIGLISQIITIIGIIMAILVIISFIKPFLKKKEKPTGE